VEIAVGVLIVLGLGAVALLATARTRAATGRLSRETRKADASELAPGAEPVVEPGAAVEHADEAARARADQSRRAAEGGSLVPTGDAGVVRYEPVDEEELGVTRRQFFNRGILASLGVGTGLFGVASIAFLWPSTGGGFGDVVTVGSIDDIKNTLGDKQPFYNAGARTYIQAYPKDAVKKAKKVYDPRLIPGMEAGYVALYQKCPHLGCRVPWCTSSQWFECPCHGSKYNRVGEKKGGPAPRGMDRFVITISGNDIVVDTSEPLQGPAIGVDTTGQGQEGAPCV
jgi:cytochrome b6-f complex iron-sulfur subunit